MFLRYHSGIRLYILLHAEQQSRKPIVNVYFGSTGTGKSRLAEREAGPQAYWHPPGSQWFSKYSGQPFVIFDDFKGGLPRQLFLRLLDRYPIHCETKGAHVEWNPEQIWITSNYHPCYWYKKLDPAPLLRRIENLIDFDPPFTYIPPIINEAAVPEQNLGSVSDPHGVWPVSI